MRQPTDQICPPEKDATVLARTLLRSEVFDHDVNPPIADRTTHFGFLESIRTRETCHLVRGFPVDQAGVPLLRHTHDAEGFVVVLV